MVNGALSKPSINATLAKDRVSNSLLPQIVNRLNFARKQKKRQAEHRGIEK